MLGLLHSNLTNSSNLTNDQRELVPLNLGYQDKNGIAYLANPDKITPGGIFNCLSNIRGLNLILDPLIAKHNSNAEQVLNELFNDSYPESVARIKKYVTDNEDKKLERSMANTNGRKKVLRKTFLTS